ncbi:MAG: ABC transporter permease subunit, partial [Chloroflexota bacterium]
IELLLTSPIRDWEVVVGKWLGAYLFLLTIIAITIIYPLMLNNMVDPGIDQGLVMSNYLAMGLASGALIALGVMISSFFNNLVASFMMTMGSLVVLWFLMGIPIQFASGRMAKALRYIEFQGHFNAMSAGVINLVDIVYFISLVALFLMLGTVSLESRRWR